MADSYKHGNKRPGSIKEKLGISSLAELLSASQEGLCSTQLVTNHYAVLLS
jgi:hypothetical protein